MARYFLHLRSAKDETLDPEGTEYDSRAAMRDAVLVAARDVMSGDIRRGLVDLRYRIDAENPSGVIVYSLLFAKALRIFSPEPTGANDR